MISHWSSEQHRRVIFTSEEVPLANTVRHRAGGVSNIILACRERKKINSHFIYCVNRQSSQRPQTPILLLTSLEQQWAPPSPRSPIRFALALRARDSASTRMVIAFVIAMIVPTKRVPVVFVIDGIAEITNQCIWTEGSSWKATMNMSSTSVVVVWESLAGVLTRDPNKNNEYNYQLCRNRVYAAISVLLERIVASFHTGASFIPL